MMKRLALLLAVTAGFLTATMVPQAMVDGYQQITRDIALDETKTTMYHELTGTISRKFYTQEKWISISTDRVWNRFVYTKSVKQGGERVSETMQTYTDDDGNDVVNRPTGICWDTRDYSSEGRHYFFVTMPDTHIINGYYYDETDDKIYRGITMTLGPENPDMPVAIDFCEGWDYRDDECWLVFTVPGENAVCIQRWYYPTPYSIPAITSLWYYGGDDLGLIIPSSVTIENWTTSSRIYIADKCSQRIIRLSVKKDADSEYPIIYHEKVYVLPEDVRPTAIESVDHQPGQGVYFTDARTGDVYLLNYSMNHLVRKYTMDTPINQAKHLSFTGGEAVYSEKWCPESGIQYFWIDCEVNNLRMTQPSISQGSYINAKFNLEGSADSVIINVKNLQGTSVITPLVYRDNGADEYTYSLLDVAGLPPGSYRVIVRAVDPFGGIETYPLHSSDTSEFTITPAYTWHSFEQNETTPYTSSFLFNNCCSSLGGHRVRGTSGTTFAHSGRFMFKLSGTDTSSVEPYYNCVDCKVFDNCNIAITKPTYLSCWIKATKAPSDAEELYISLDGIIQDANYSWKQLKQWTKYGKCIDQYGQWIHGGYHPVPVDSQWHYYVFSLTPAAGDTIQKLQFSYWGVPVENTGDFEVYLDDISITSNHPWNMWYAETFGNGSGSSHTNGDPNFELGLSHKDEDGGSCYGGARIIVDGHGDSGEGSHWLSPVPSLRKDFHPYKQLHYSIWSCQPPIEDTTCKVSWMQYDKAHATLLGFLIDDRWLYYVWNSPQRWPDVGYVQMCNPTEHEYVYDEWQIFTRDLYRDYMDEYPTASAPQELQAYRIMHYCRSDWDGDNGGIVKGPIFMDGGPDTPGSNNVPTVIRPNGGEKWIEGTDKWYIHGIGQDLPKYIAVYWTDNFGMLGMPWDWKLVEIREFQPPPPGMGYTGVGVWHVPSVDEEKPHCAFKTVGLNMQGFPLPGQVDISDAPFTIVDLFVSQPDDGRQFCSTPQIPGTSPSIGWQANGVCGVEEIDLYYTTQGGYDQQVMASNFMSGGGDIWTSIASGLSPGTYQPIDSIYDSYEDTTYYEHAYVGAYDDWVVPNIPTSGGNLKFVAHDSTGDSALYIMPQTFNIPFGGATAYSTAQTADKIVTDASQTHLVYADESGNILTSSNSDTYEWEELDTIGQGQLPSLTLNDDGDPCAVWVTGTENQQNLTFSQYVQGAWSGPVVIAPANPTDATRYSESTLRNICSDSFSLATFKANGDLGQGYPVFNRIGLVNTRYTGNNPISQVLDTVWATLETPLTPITKAPSYLIDAYTNDHYAFNWGDSTIYIYIDADVHLEGICESPVLWPCLSATDGNIYLTYGVEVGGETCLIQRWKHPQDTIWRGEDTLYKGSLAYTQTLGGAATLLCSSSGELSRLSFDPVEDTTSIVPVGEDTYYPHGALSYLGLEDGLPLIWTQQSGSSFYIATDWHDPDETIFPSYYINAGEELTPYTQYRDSTVDYGEASVDWGSDSVTYELDNLDPLCSHTLLLEFYFEDQDHYTRKYFITAAGQTDTIDFTTYDLERVTMGIPGGVSNITVKITSDSGSVEVSRLLFYQGEEAGGMMMMSTKEAKKQPIPYVLYQNFPNPFVGTTRIRYALPYDRHVSLKVYDVTGRRVRTLVDDHKTPGIYDLIWDGKDNTRFSLPAGVYFIRFATEDFEQTKKAVLLK
jgi:hypothetical protein